MASKTFDSKALLERHGWKFGSGLGKDEGGIKEAIKVDLKMDRAGMGYDASEKYSFQWWDHVFNSAANSIEVVSDENGVSIRKTSTVKVSTKKQSKRKQTKPKTYGCFVKSATLTNSGIEVKDSDSDSSSSSDSDVGIISKMTDEELFKACGGMTGHKGARHGLNLRGKLLRIQQHDEQFLRSQMTSNGSALNRSPADSLLENAKMKTGATHGSGVTVEQSVLPRDGQDETNAVSSSCPKNSVGTEKKKQKREIEEGEDETKESTDDVKPSTTEMIRKGKNKKRKEGNDLDTGEIEMNNADSEERTSCSNVRKKKRNRECDDDSFVPNGASTDKEIISCDGAETNRRKIKKRTKHTENGPEDGEDLIDEEQSVDQMTENSEKKSKKLKKKKREEKKQEESLEKEPFSDKNQTEATEPEGLIEQSKKRKKKNQDKEVVTGPVDQSVEDASMQKKKCKKSKKSGHGKEASVDEIMDQEHNTKGSKLQDKKCKNSELKEHHKRDVIINNETEKLAAHESPRIKCKHSKKHPDETEAVLPVLESTDHVKDSKTASKKSKKRKREDEERNLEGCGNNAQSCDSEAFTSSNVRLENHTSQPKAKRPKKNSCVDSVGKTDNCNINNASDSQQN